MRYPANIVPDEGNFLVTFPDIPEAITCGDTRDEAVLMAADALLTALDFYFSDRRPVPPPSKAKRGQTLIELAPSVAAKVLLLNEMLAQGVRPADLARRLNTSAQEVNRLTNVMHTTRIDSVAEALKAIGKRLEVAVV
jgi:antitoxin HicB